MTLISSLLNSMRALTLHDTSVKSMIAVTTQYKIQLRELHLQQPMFKSVEEKLGLPAKPKKPIAPFFRFSNEMRPSVIANNPHLKYAQINSILGTMWKTLDVTKKEKFTKGFQVELSDYFSNEYTKYRATLSEDDKRKIKELKVKIKNRRILSSRRKQNRALGKPKRPMNSFLRYVKAQTDRKLNENYKDYIRRLTLTWKGLTDAEKEEYKSPKEHEEYEKAMLKWEENMRELGHDDVIRVTSK